MPKLNKGGNTVAIDPVCGMELAPGSSPATRQHAGQTFYFCSSECVSTFEAEPHRYTHKEAAASVGVPTATDPVCGMEVDPESAAATRRRQGQLYYFCSARCAETFDTAHAMLDHLSGG